MPIALDQVTFGYRRRAVLCGLDLRFPPGRTVFLGPNGAGKSTTLALAASDLRPRSGSVTYGGLSATRRRTRGDYRGRVSWLPQRVESLPGLTVREQVAYVGWLKGMNRADAWEKARETVGRVELTDHLDRKVRQLSGGQQRRVGIAQSLVHGAEVLLLDEPTAGMDPRQRRVFHDILAGLTQHVILSTHDVTDLEGSYEHVVVLTDGTVRFHGTVRDFLALAPAGTADGQRAEAAYHATVGEAAWA